MSLEELKNRELKKKDEEIERLRSALWGSRRYFHGLTIAHDAPKDYPCVPWCNACIRNRAIDAIDEVLGK